jgi:hypothetical protein
MRIDTQFKQTLIGTAAVGATFGLIFALVTLAFAATVGPRMARVPGHGLTLGDVPSILAAFFVPVVLCIVVFAVLPWSIQQGLVWLAKRRTGGA